MGRIEATSLAYKRSILATNPAASRRDISIRDCAPNLGFALVCWSHP
jgi:hypothetical protein